MEILNKDEGVHQNIDNEVTAAPGNIKDNHIKSNVGTVPVLIRIYSFFAIKFSRKRRGSRREMN